MRIYAILLVGVLYGCSPAIADQEAVKENVNVKKTDLEAILEKSKKNSEEATLVSASADKSLVEKVEKTASKIEKLEKTVEILTKKNDELIQKLEATTADDAPFTLDAIVE